MHNLLCGLLLGIFLDSLYVDLPKIWTNFEFKLLSTSISKKTLLRVSKKEKLCPMLSNKDKVENVIVILP